MRWGGAREPAAGILQGRGASFSVQPGPVPTQTQVPPPRARRQTPVEPGGWESQAERASQGDNGRPEQACESKRPVSWRGRDLPVGGPSARLWCPDCSWEPLKVGIGGQRCEVRGAGQRVMGRPCALVPQGCGVSSGLKTLRHRPPRGQAGPRCSGEDGPQILRLDLAGVGACARPSCIPAVPQQGLEEALLPTSSSGPHGARVRWPWVQVPTLYPPGSLSISSPRAAYLQPGQQLGGS